MSTLPNLWNSMKQPPPIFPKNGPLPQSETSPSETPQDFWIRCVIIEFNPHSSERKITQDLAFPLLQDYHTLALFFPASLLPKEK